MENEKYYTGWENNNLQNVSSIQNCISNIDNFILKTVNWRNAKNTKGLHLEQLDFQNWTWNSVQLLHGKVVSKMLPSVRRLLNAHELQFHKFAMTIFINGN